ncbi:phosphoribosyltransferase [Vreelandella rituensis]|nr:phosphoribosyltransferase [Halomonas rituensis]
MTGQAERAPWGRGFPSVMRNGENGTLKAHPRYAEAKGGSPEAALDVVTSLLSPQLLEQVRALADAHGSQPTLVPVIAEEATGRNWLPMALAKHVERALGFPLTTAIVQASKVARTDKGADYRLVHNPCFAGAVDPGRTYLILDDTIGMGGTLASLRGYIENRGGEVIGASVMTAHPGALELPITHKMLHKIDAKHGPGMNVLCEDILGHGLDRLTQGEAGHFAAAKSVEAMRERLEAQLAAPATGAFLAEVELFFEALRGYEAHLSTLCREGAAGRRALGRRDGPALVEHLDVVTRALEGVRIPPLLKQQMAHAQAQLVREVMPSTPDASVGQPSSTSPPVERNIGFAAGHPSRSPRQSGKSLEPGYDSFKQ